MSDSSRPKDEGNDDVLLVGETLPGDGGYTVLRRREDRLELGALREMREGRPLSGEIVKLTPRPEHERLFNVEVLVKLPARAGSGPAQVASDAYRRGWDGTFGGNN